MSMKKSVTIKQQEKILKLIQGGINTIKEGLQDNMQFPNLEIYSDIEQSSKAVEEKSSLQ